MYRLLSRRRQRAALCGWIKWIPVLALPFSLMFFDAWLNIETRNNDYDFSRLTSQVRALTEELKAARVEKADKENLEELAAKAPDLGLVEPDPNQVMTLRWDGQWRERPGQVPFALARVQGMAGAAPAVSAAETAPAAPVESAAPAPIAAAGNSVAAPMPLVSALAGAVGDDANIASIESMEEAKLLGSVTME